MTPDEAAQTSAALDALDAVLAGDDRSSIAYFADLVDARAAAAAASQGKHAMTMTIPMPLAAGADAAALSADRAALHARTATPRSAPDNFDAVHAAAPATRCCSSPRTRSRYKETLDLAVIVPEIARAFPGRFAVGVLLPEAAREFQPRYGFRRWPAFVLLQDGEYVGAVDGLRNWDEYVDRGRRACSPRAPTRPPTVGIAVKGAGDGARRLRQLTSDTS